jgi:hypothetical protein
MWIIAIMKLTGDGPMSTFSKKDDQIAYERGGTAGQIYARSDHGGLDRAPAKGGNGQIPCPFPLSLSSEFE